MLFYNFRILIKNLFLHFHQEAKLEDRILEVRAVEKELE